MWLPFGKVLLYRKERGGGRSGLYLEVVRGMHGPLGPSLLDKKVLRLHRKEVWLNHSLWFCFQSQEVQCKTQLIECQCVYWRDIWCRPTLIFLDMLVCMDMIWKFLRTLTQTKPCSSQKLQSIFSCKWTLHRFIYNVNADGLSHKPVECHIETKVVCRGQF